MNGYLSDKVQPVKRYIALCFCILSTSSTLAAGPLDNVTCSWLGKPFAGTGVNKWVQQDIEDLFVARRHCLRHRLLGRGRRRGHRLQNGDV